jgi:DNA-binding transcriptional regulator of glucitol operon
MSLFDSHAEMWAFLAVLVVLAFIVALLLAGCQMPLRTIP